MNFLKVINSKFFLLTNPSHVWDHKQITGLSGLYVKCLDQQLAINQHSINVIFVITVNYLFFS